jgi:hypothetical protein
MIELIVAYSVDELTCVEHSYLCNVCDAKAE